MADTPDQGAALTSVVESQAAFNSANEAMQADPDNAELKTAFETAETSFKDAETNYGAFFKGEGDWPDDWQDKYLNSKEGLDDEAKEKLSKRVGRYASAPAALDAMIAAQNKISSGDLTSKLGDNATDAEIAEYRKDNNIPEEAAGYEPQLAEGFVIGEGDKPVVDSFLKSMHDGNASQEQVSKALNWYFENQNEMLEQRHVADEAYLAASNDEITMEWGTNKKANLNAIENFFADAPEGLYEALRLARAPDGATIGVMPDALRFFAAKALALNPASTLVPGSGEKQAEAMADEIAELEKEMGTDEWYKDNKKQARYMALVNARDKRK